MQSAKLRENTSFSLPQLGKGDRLRWMRCSHRSGVILYLAKTRMLRILHLIACYAGASPQGEA